MSFAADYIDGNDKDLPDEILDNATFELKFDHGLENNEVVTSGAITITGTSGGGKTLDWESDGQPITHVFVKAGDGGYLFTYDPAAYSGSVYTPENNGGNQAALSHITFFYVPPEEDPVGALRITKEFSGDTPPEGDYEFTFLVEGPGGFSEEVTIINEGSVLLEDLEPGEYTITEEDLPDYFSQVSITDDGEVEVVADDTTDVTVDNAYTEPKGSITLSKVVEDQEGNELDNVNMSFTINVKNESLNFDEDFIVPAGGSKEVEDLSFGTYIISEPSVPNGFSLESIDPSSVTIDEDGENVDVTITNTKDEEPTLGALSIEKVLWGVTESPIENDDTVFTVRLIGPDPSEDYVDVEISAGETKLVNNLTPGTYLIDEVDIPDGYEFSGTSEVNNSVTIVAGETEEITVDNFKVPVGDLEISKVLQGWDEEEITDDDTLFTITVMGPYPDTDTFEVELKGGESETIEGLEPGMYMIQEDSVPEGYSFGWIEVDGSLSIVPNLQVEPQIIDELPQIPQEENVVFVVPYSESSATVYNWKDPVAELTIEKILEGDDVPEGTDMEFTFQITHPDESTSLETIEGAGTITVEDLPLGTYLIEELASDMPANFSLVSDNNLSITFDQQNLEGSVSFTNTYEEPPAGDLIVQKVLSGDTPPDAVHEFDFTVEGGDFYESFSITGSDSYTIEDLAPGAYTVTETGMPAIFEFESIASGEITLTEVQSMEVTVEDDGTTRVIVTNTYDEPEEPTPEGSLVIEKNIFNELIPEGSNTFTFSIEGPDYSSTRTIDGEGEVTISGLAPGSYTVTETDLPEDFLVVSIASGETLLEAGSITVDVVDDGTTRVVVTNVYDEPEEPEETFSSLTIEKVLTGDTEPAGTNNFVFSITGPDFSDTVTIDGEGLETLTGLVPGSYTVTETDMPANFDFVSIASGELVITAEQSIVVSVSDDLETTVVVTNDYDAPTPPDEPEDNDEPADDDDDEPGGPTTFIDLTTDEVEIEEPLPQAPALPERPKVVNPPEEEIILDEPIPEAPAALPQTGELPPSLFYGLGSLLSLMGVTLKKKGK